MIPGYGENPDYASEWNDPLAADPHGLLDWAHVRSGNVVDREYVIPGLITARTGVSIYSEAGAGKSLLGFEWAACLAMGEPILGEPVKTRTVLYLDLENDLLVIRDRLEAFGLLETGDLSRLHYSLLGDWKPLDTPEGGRQLYALVSQLNAEVVFIDTTSRIISGPENDADTFLNLYQHTMLPMKAAGHTVIRFDHAGKDPSKKERGSSAKQTDVDLIYRLAETESGLITLKREKNRPHLDGPELVTLQRSQEPLRHGHASDNARLRDIIRTASDLDRLGAPLDISKRKARDLLAGAGISCRWSRILDALNYRRARAGGGAPGPSYRDPGPGTDPPGETQGGRDHPGDHLFYPAGTGWEPVP